MNDRNNKIILIAGIVLLFVGIIFFVYMSNRSKEEAGNTNKKIEALLKEIDTASPRFEIGYAEMSMEYFKNNLAKYETGSRDFFTFPVYRNDITSRVKSDTPSVAINLDKMIIKNKYLKDVQLLNKQHKLKQGSINIICLIIKQVGKGEASNVSMKADKVLIRDIEDIYDPLDIGGNDFDEEGIRHEWNKVEQEVFNIGKMETGKSMLIPICITNFFICTEEGHDPSGWQLASNTAYVPISILYNTRAGETTITVKDNLGKPIVID
jgi:hypothetical protein